MLNGVSEHNSRSCLLHPAARKRHKKDRDRTWECEERESRRNSWGHEGRRGSGSRQRERSPEDSDIESPPPNLSDCECPLQSGDQDWNRNLGLMFQW